MGSNATHSYHLRNLGELMHIPFLQATTPGSTSLGLIAIRTRMIGLENLSGIDFWLTILPLLRKRIQPALTSTHNSHFHSPLEMESSPALARPFQERYV